MSDSTGRPRGERCPAPDLLRAVAAGDVPLAVIDRVGAHVERCPACQRAFAALDAGPGDASLRGLLAGGPAGGEATPDRLVRMIRAAEGVSGVVWGAAPADDRPVPRTLGQYELVEPVGRGGMGVVYKARHTRMDRAVAVKVLPPDRVRDADAVARFRREVKAAAALDHPHVVRAYDANEVGGEHFLVTEFVPGMDLARVVRAAGPLAVADACEAARQAAAGLAHAHERGLVHRDLKPSNLLLAVDGTVKVADFGLARLGPAGGGGPTDAGAVLGTLDYMAPEQGLDGRAADARSDVYSLGCTLYALLTGAAPFGGPDHDTPGKKLLAHARDPAPPVRTRRPDVPAGLAAVVGRMLTKEPAARYATAAEAAAAVAPFAAGADLRGLCLRATGAAPGREPAPPAAGPPPAGRPGRWRRPAVAAVLGLAVVAAVLGVRASRPRTSGTEPPGDTADRPAAGVAGAAPAADPSDPTAGVRSAFRDFPLSVAEFSPPAPGSGADATLRYAVDPARYRAFAATAAAALRRAADRSGEAVLPLRGGLISYEEHYDYPGLDLPADGRAALDRAVADPAEDGRCRLLILAKGADPAPGGKGHLLRVTWFTLRGDAGAAVTAAVHRGADLRLRLSRGAEIDDRSVRPYRLERKDNADAVLFPGGPAGAAGFGTLDLPLAWGAWPLDRRVGRVVAVLPGFFVPAGRAGLEFRTSVELPVRLPAPAAVGGPVTVRAELPDE